MINLPVETILEATPRKEIAGVRVIGRSRENLPIRGFVAGRGPIRLSLIGGCHADEPVGPAMLLHLACHLSKLDAHDPLLAQFRWVVIPHVNPDGERRNLDWSAHPLETRDHQGTTDRGYDPALYVRHVVRELPGDDIEFGFPHGETDSEARPENLAVARFLQTEGPVHLHGSFHGMGFAPGPWFLIEPVWIDRTSTMREGLRQRVSEMGYPLFDIDRKGEKGFRRIDQGFSTRPDSRAMRAHFLENEDPITAAKFRPSSMEFVRDLGGDPLTFVSEMPLFLTPSAGLDSKGPKFETGTEGRRRLLSELQALASGTLEKARTEIAQLGIRAMPIRDQMRLQLAFLESAINSVLAHAPEGPPR